MLLNWNLMIYKIVITFIFIGRIINSMQLIIIIFYIDSNLYFL